MAIYGIGDLGREWQGPYRVMLADLRRSIEEELRPTGRHFPAAGRLPVEVFIHLTTDPDEPRPLGPHALPCVRIGPQAIYDGGTGLQVTTFGTPETFRTNFGVGSDEAIRRVVTLLDWVDGQLGRTQVVRERDLMLQLELEAFVVVWSHASGDLSLSPDDQRAGDAMARMVAELAKGDGPPRGVLQAVFNWFGAKLDVFADESAKAAGKAFGAAAGAAAGVAVTGQLPRLIDAVGRISDLLGRR